MKPLRAWWCLSPNFGDALAPLFIREYGYTPCYTESPGRYLLSGSILNHAKQPDTVWGVGLANEADVVRGGIRVYGTRGPLSLAKARAAGVIVNDAFCDSGFLVPSSTVGSAVEYDAKSYRDRFSLDLDLAIVPHYTELESVFALQEPYRGDPPLCLVDVLEDDIYQTIFDIAAAERVASSSLHGLSVAAAYGRPFCAVLPGKAVLGDGFKYRDLYASMNLRWDPTSWEDVLAGRAKYREISEHTRLDLIRVAQETFPLKLV